MVEKKRRRVVREELKRRRVGLDISVPPIWGWIGRDEIRERRRQVGLDEKKRRRFEVVGVWLSSSCMALAVIWGFFFFERQIETEQAEVEKQTCTVEKFDECYNFWCIYKTCLAGNQNPLKLHQRPRLNNTKWRVQIKGVPYPFFWEER